MASRPQTEHRVVACLKALAVGDAIAKQTETLSFEDIPSWYPDGVRGFEGTPGEIIPHYLGRRYEWRIGETTDDTEQTLCTANAILTEQPFTHTSVGRELLACTKSVHPGVSMWSFLQAADASRTALDGDGCGAAMRVSPVGVRYRSGEIDRIVRDAYECSIPTHGGQFAICAAAAVAAAVSAALDELPPADVLTVAIQASIAAKPLRPPTRSGAFAEALAAMHRDLCNRSLTADFLAQRYFPDAPETKVPLAISLALITQSARATTLMAANVGGDSDTVASIGSAIAGALRPETVDDHWFDIVTAVNRDPIVEVARSLAGLRR